MTTLNPEPPMPAAPPPTRRRRSRALPWIISGAVAAGLCCVGGTVFALTGDGDQPASRPAAPATTRASTGTAAGCLPVDAKLVDRIDDAAQAGTGMKMTGKAAAVRSAGHAKVWLVAAEFTASGVPAQVGVWATNALDGTAGLVLAADGFAKQFTDWPDAAGTDARIGAADPAVLAAQACMRR